MATALKQAETFTKVFFYFFNLMLGGAGATGGWYLLMHLDMVGVHPAAAFAIGAVLANMTYQIAKKMYYRTREGKMATSLGYGAVEEMGILYYHTAIVGFINPVFFMGVFWGIESGIIR